MRQMGARGRASATLAAILLVLAASGPVQAQSGSRQAEVLTASDAGTLRVPDGLTARLAIDRAIADKAWDRAASLLVTEAERRPQDADLLVLTARAFFLDRKPLNSAIALKKAEAIRALQPGERFLLVLSYIALGQGDWASPELERLSASDPENVTYTYWLGRIEYDKGRFESAASRFRAAIAGEPRHVRAWDNLGLCYEALNRMDDAAAAYETAVAANREEPTPSAWPPLNFAGLLRRQGALERAESLLREAVRYDAALAQAHYELGVVLEQTGDTAGAVESLQRAANADRTYADPFYALSRIYRRQGRRSDADTALATFERLKHRRSAAQP
jgi:tetratricopeptide (TPR) repeat protein